MTQTVTELEIVESLDFHEEQACEVCEIDYRRESKAEVYLWRPPCDHYPEGRVFPACKEWKQRHFGGGHVRRIVCCPHVRCPETDIRYVGPIK